jgi:peptidoglycan/xylan/chitin deacetylase (PgdA/CDA1 family)
LIGALQRHGIPGVYGFVNGGQIHDNPGLDVILRAWHEAGLLLGNHTYSHMDLNRVSAAEFVEDIERNEATLGGWSPATTSRYFRYPYLHEGDTLDKRTSVRTWLRARGYTVAQVTVYFDDWAWDDAYARCVARDDRQSIARLQTLFLDAARRALAWSTDASTRLFDRQVTHILLLHVGAFGALMLDDVLSLYRSTGVTFVGLESAVRDPAYAINPDLSWVGQRTFLAQVAQARQVVLPPAVDLQSDLQAMCR